MPTLIDRAIAIACDAHAGQVDKTGEPHIFHPLRVMLALHDPVERVVGVLHDVVEDSPRWSFDLLRGRGFGSDVLDALRVLTNSADLPYLDFIGTVAESGNPIAIAVKLAAVRDHLAPKRASLLGDGERRRYMRAVAILSGEQKEGGVAREGEG